MNSQYKLAVTKVKLCGLGSWQLSWLSGRALGKKKSDVLFSDFWNS